MKKYFPFLEKYFLDNRLLQTPKQLSEFRHEDTVKMLTIEQSIGTVKVVI